MLVRPGLSEAGNTRRREPARIWAEQSRECVLKVAAGDAPEIQDRDQNFEALRATGVGRQDCGCEPDAALTGPTAVANPWRMHGDRAKAGHDHALRPMPMAHQPLAAVFGVLVSVAGKEGGDLRLDGLRQQRPRARAPARRTSVSGSENSAGWISWTTLSWVTACPSFGGEVEARTPPRYAASTPHAVTNFRAYLKSAPHCLS